MKLEYVKDVPKKRSSKKPRTEYRMMATKVLQAPPATWAEFSGYSTPKEAERVRVGVGLNLKRAGKSYTSSVRSIYDDQGNLVECRIYFKVL